MHKDDNRVIRYKELKAKIDISRSTLDRWEKKNKFPKRIELGENSMGWLLKDVDQWLADRKNGK